LKVFEDWICIHFSGGKGKGNRVKKKSPARNCGKAKPKLKLFSNCLKTIVFYIRMLHLMLKSIKRFDKLKNDVGKSYLHIKPKQDFLFKPN